MQPTSTTSAPSHLSSTRRLLALHLIRARERAGLSRAQLSERSDFSPDEIEGIESGARTVDPAELRAWCRAVGASFVEFAREFDAALSAQEAGEKTRQQAQAVARGLANIYLLRFSPGAFPELLAVENSPQGIKSLLGTTRVRVFATGHAATLGLSAAASTRENSARGADDQEDCTLLHPEGAFLVVAGAFAGAEVSPSAPRNQGLAWAPLAAWVPLCPGALDLSVADDWQRLKLESLSPLQLELTLDRFVPRLSHGALVEIMGAHPDGEAWMAAWD